MTETKVGRERPANLETKESPGYRPGTDFDKSPTTQAEADALRVKNAHIPVVRVESAKAITLSSDHGDADTLAHMIADKVKVGRRAREIATVQRRVNEIVGDSHTLTAINAAERHGAISREGARSMRRDLVMKRRAR